MQQYLAGIDVGTTGTRCVIFDLDGTVIGGAYREYATTYLQPGWVEQDGDAMIVQTMLACKAAVAHAGVSAQDIAAIGFSTQRDVTCAVDRQGQLVRPLISWQDTRPLQEVQDLLELVTAEEYYAISGFPLIPNWMLPKILWMRRHESAHYAATAKFTQLQDLILKAFGAEAYYTDIPDMSFYGVWDVRAASWSERLLALLQVSPDLFGQPTPPGTQVGTVPPTVAAHTGFAVGTPLCVGASDQNCAVLGMGAIAPGMATVTLGTAGVAIVMIDTPATGLGGMCTAHHAVPSLWQLEGGRLCGSECLPLAA
jgi:xylulokinase